MPIYSAQFDEIQYCGIINSTVASDKSVEWLTSVYPRYDGDNEKRDAHSANHDDRDVSGWVAPNRLKNIVSAPRVDVH